MARKAKSVNIIPIWRQEWHSGVVIDGVWVSAYVLAELDDRPQNTEVTYQEPLLVSPDVKAVLLKHGLATAQTRGGIYAGPEFAEFYRALRWPPKPQEGP